MGAVISRAAKERIDADDVRIRACGPLVALCGCMHYSAVWTEAHNFDKANYQYLLRGLLVHLDGPSPEIQQAIVAVLTAAMVVDPVVFTSEVVAVRERHRSPKLCDMLAEQARAAHGQLV